MTEHEITLTVKQYEEGGPLEISIEKVDFLTKEGKKEAVEKIFICIPSNEREGIKNILESKKSDGGENKTFVLKYDDEHLEVENDDDNFMCSKATGPQE